MKAFKLLLAALLAVVTALYGFTAFLENASGKHIGPTISCPQEVLEVSVLDPEETFLSGITAQDQQDGDLTSHILIQAVSRQITDNMTNVNFLVFDSDGNSASATRSIRYTDYVSPRFSINQPLVYNDSTSIALLDRLQVIDCIDGDITNNIRVSNLVSTTDPEIYTIDVQATNSLSDTVRLALPLVIYSSTGYRAEIQLSNYLVYLDKGAFFQPRQYLRSVSLPLDAYGNLSDVKIDSNVNTSEPGTYMVTYRYPYEGTTALAVLTVIVE